MIQTSSRTTAVTATTAPPSKMRSQQLSAGSIKRYARLAQPKEVNCSVVANKPATPVGSVTSGTNRIAGPTTTTTSSSSSSGHGRMTPKSSSSSSSARRTGVPMMNGKCPRSVPDRLIPAGSSRTTTLSATRDVGSTRGTLPRGGTPSVNSRNGERTVMMMTMARQQQQQQTIRRPPDPDGMAMRNRSGVTARKPTAAAAAAGPPSRCDKRTVAAQPTNPIAVRSKTEVAAAASSSSSSRIPRPAVRNLTAKVALPSSSPDLSRLGRRPTSTASSTASLTSAGSRLLPPGSIVTATRMAAKAGSSPALDAPVATMRAQRCRPGAIKTSPSPMSSQLLASKTKKRASPAPVKSPPDLKPGKNEEKEEEEGGGGNPAGCVTQKECTSSAAAMVSGGHCWEPQGRGNPKRPAEGGGSFPLPPPPPPLLLEEPPPPPPHPAAAPPLTPVVFLPAEPEPVPSTVHLDSRCSTSGEVSYARLVVVLTMDSSGGDVRSLPEVKGGEGDEDDSPSGSRGMTAGSCEMLSRLECEQQSIRCGSNSASSAAQQQPTEEELLRLERDIELLYEDEPASCNPQQRSLSLPKSFLANRYGLVGFKAALPSVRFPWRKGVAPAEVLDRPASSSSTSFIQSEAGPGEPSQQSSSLPPSGSLVSSSVASTVVAAAAASRRLPGSTSVTRTARRLKTNSSPVFLTGEEEANRSHSAWDLASSSRPWSAFETGAEPATGLMMMLMGAGEPDSRTTNGVSSLTPSSTHPAVISSTSPTPAQAGSSATLRKFRKSFSLRLSRRSSQEEPTPPPAQEDETDCSSAASQQQQPPSPKFRFGPLVWRASRERNPNKKGGPNDKAARNAKCNSGDSGVQMETTPIHRAQHHQDESAVRRTQSDLGGEAVIVAAIQQTWSQTITRQVNQPPEDDGEDEEGEEEEEDEESQPDSATSGVSSSRSSQKLTRHLAKAKLRRSASQPAVALTAGCNPSDEDAGLCLSEDDNLSDNDHPHHHHQHLPHHHPQAENEVVRYSPATEGVLAIALWDHKAIEPEELSLSAGDVVHILDLSDPDWWWAATTSTSAGRQASYGWLPASYVQLCEPPFNRTLKEQLQGRQVSTRMLIGPAALSQHSVRANVINELITAERDYVKLLSDLVDGYLVPMRNRPDLFSPGRIQAIFGNLEDLYRFQKNFLVDLELSLNWNSLEDSVVGGCFIQHTKEFTIYATYCNNQDRAAAEMQLLCEDVRYLRFFEACRLLRRMIRLPLEAFLLSPVQKICKYPLQLAELLKHTDEQHPDRRLVSHALDSMRSVAYLVNESKRRAEMHQFLVQWQSCVDHWMGTDITVHNCCLIRQGEMFKVSSSGWTREVTLFLFDKELVICKKELIKRSSLVYKDRLRVDDIDVMDQPLAAAIDGRPHAFQLRSRSRAKCYLLSCRSAQEKNQWLGAIEQLQRHPQPDCWIPVPATTAAATTTMMTLGRTKLGPKRNNKVKHNPALSLTLEEAYLTLAGRDHVTNTTTTTTKNNNNKKS